MDDIISIGIDPDVHNCAVGYIQYENGKMSLGVEIIRNKEGAERAAAINTIQTTAFRDLFEIKGNYLLTVEGQDANYTGRTCARPNDILNLALITGAAITLYKGGMSCYSPLPREWKGTVPKDIKQKRILDHLGLKYHMAGGKHPYPVPSNYAPYVVGGCKVNDGDWKDITDALGLAVWGLEKYLKENPTRS